MDESLNECVVIMPLADGRRRLLVRGHAEVRIEPGATVLRGDGSAGWRERILQPHELIAVSIAAAGVPVPPPLWDPPAASPSFPPAPYSPAPYSPAPNSAPPPVGAPADFPPPARPFVPSPVEAAQPFVLPSAPVYVPPPVPARVTLVAPGVGFDDSLSNDSLSRAEPHFLDGSASYTEGRRVLRTAGGQVIELDGSVIIGRAPRLERGMQYDVVPKLVTIEGTNDEVSRSHVRIDAAGGDVIVTDLGSRNGTLYAMPGRPAVLLRDGEQAKVPAGTIIDLGSDVRFTVGRAI